MSCAHDLPKHWQCCACTHTPDWHWNPRVCWCALPLLFLLQLYSLLAFLSYTYLLVCQMWGATLFFSHSMGQVTILTSNTILASNKICLLSCQFNFSLSDKFLVSRFVFCFSYTAWRQLALRTGEYFNAFQLQSTFLFNQRIQWINKQWLHLSFSFLLLFFNQCCRDSMWE